MKKLLIFLLILFISASAVSAKVIYRLNNNKNIALTFDDGPNSTFTPQILDILKKYDIKATFFVIGKKISDNIQLLERINYDGHQIANHTFFHSRLNWVDNNKLIKELELTSDLIEILTAKKTKLFRPPNGYLPKDKSKIIQASGYDIVMWTINADDISHKGKKLRSSDSIARRVLSKVKGGDIILMHDSSEQTVKSLKIIIPALLKKGYKFTTIKNI